MSDGWQLRPLNTDDESTCLLMPAVTICLPVSVFLLLYMTPNRGFTCSAVMFRDESQSEQQLLTFNSSFKELEYNNLVNER